MEGLPSSRPSVADTGIRGYGGHGGHGGWPWSRPSTSSLEPLALGGGAARAGIRASRPLRQGRERCARRAHAPPLPQERLLAYHSRQRHVLEVQFHGEDGFGSGVTQVLPRPGIARLIGPVP